MFEKLFLKPDLIRISNVKLNYADFYLPEF